LRCCIGRRSFLLYEVIEYESMKKPNKVLDDPVKVHIWISQPIVLSLILKHRNALSHQEISSILHVFGVLGQRIG
jgi:hypothetical protein